MVGPPRDVMGDGAQVSFPGSSRDQVSGWDPHSEMMVYVSVPSKSEEGGHGAGGVGSTDG